MDLQQTIAQMPGYFLQKDLNSRYIGSNNNTAQLFGFNRPDELVGITDYDIRCDAVEHADTFLLQDKKLLESGGAVKFLDIHAYQNGDIKCLLINKVLTQSPRAPTILCHCTEINELVLNQLLNLINNSGNNLIPHQFKTQLDCYQLSEDFDFGLSKRESECLFYLLRGSSARQTGAILNISSKTVESYISIIKIKLNCTNKRDLFDFALDKGLLHIIPASLLC